ncbi:MAG: hypothetical protein PHU88_08450 [candidate division Zixibacteria bacterium]|nr:hypothetical protein [candidate division Zixibacteria bacterium]MDD5426993.1 hypothetical protein [candidate division Zixibacteria bacterium]
MSCEEIKKYLEQLLGQKLKDRPIRAIGVNPRYHGLPKRLIEEGGIYDNLEPGAPSERVLAIFEGTLFCVCTTGRGAGTGMPYLFHREDIYTVEYF